MLRLRPLLHGLLALLWLGQGILAAAAPLPAAQLIAAADAELPPCHRGDDAQPAKQPAEPGGHCCCPGEHCIHAPGQCPMSGSAAVLPCTGMVWSACKPASDSAPRRPTARPQPDPGSPLRPPSPLSV